MENLDKGDSSTNKRRPNGPLRQPTYSDLYRRYHDRLFTDFPRLSTTASTASPKDLHYILGERGFEIHSAADLPQWYTKSRLGALAREEDLPRAAGETRRVSAHDWMFSEARAWGEARFGAAESEHLSCWSSASAERTLGADATRRIAESMDCGPSARTAEIQVEWVRSDSDSEWYARRQLYVLDGRIIDLRPEGDAFPPTGDGDIGPLRPPARELEKNEHILLTPAQGLQTRRTSQFEDVVLGPGRGEDTKYLWTIDQRGVNVALESTPFDTNRGHIVHSNISTEAYIGGEAWFLVEPNGTDPTSARPAVIINAGSGRFGDAAGITEKQWDAAIRLWESLGYVVYPVPFGRR